MTHTWTAARSTAARTRRGVLNPGSYPHALGYSLALFLICSRTLAVRYDDPPPRADEEEYDFLLQAVPVARDSSLVRFADKHPFKRYQDRKEKLKASWMLERFREVVNSQTSGMGYGARGQRESV